MTIKELKEILDKYPEDSIIAYRHNKYSVVDIDELSFKEDQLLSGQKVKILILEASFEED